MVKLKKSGEKRAAIEDICQRCNLVNLFKGVNIFDIVFEAFGAKSFFMTTGKLLIDIVEATNLPYLDIFKLQHAYSYCSVGLRGCETLENRNWWDYYFTTKTVNRSQNPRYDEQCCLYVTSLDLQILHIKVYHSKLGIMPVLLGECEIELCDLDFNEYDELKLSLPLLVPKFYQVSAKLNDEEETSLAASLSCLVKVDQTKPEPVSVSAFSSMAAVGEVFRNEIKTPSPAKVGNVILRQFNSMTSSSVINETPIIHLKLRYIPHIKREKEEVEANPCHTEDIMKEQFSDDSDEPNLLV